MARPPRRPSIRPSLVDAGWEEVPSLVPLDTVVGGSTESNELTAPLPRDRRQATEVSEHTLSDPTGDIDELLAEPSSSLGLPSFASPPSSRPPPPSRRPPMPSRPPPPPQRVQSGSVRPPPPSQRPPPPSHRPPPPSHRPPPPSHRPPSRAHTRPFPPPPSPPDSPSYATAPLSPMSAYAPTEPMPVHEPPSSHPARVAPPRAHMPSEMPVQVMHYDQGRIGMRREDSVLSELGLDRPSEPVAEPPPSSISPSSRLPAGIVIPDAQATTPAGGLFAPPPPSVQRPPSAEATQPASRSRGAPQSTTVPSPIVPDMVTVEPPEPIARALAQRVRFGSNVAPLWAPIGAAAGAIVVLFSGLFLTVGLLAGGDEPQVVPSASAAPGEPAEGAPTPETLAPSEAPKPARSVTEKAAQGDEKALFELSGRPPKERSIAEALAIATGQSELRKRELRMLADEAKHAGFANDASNIKKLLEFLKSDDTAQASLEILARLPSAVGPDVLYQVWTATTKKSPTTELAEALVLSKEVRQKASPALAVALDLRTAGTCDETKQVLVRAAEHADRRSLHLIGRLTRKTGCGEKKRDDCHPCLREGDEIKDAIKQARRKASPRY